MPLLAAIIRAVMERLPSADFVRRFALKFLQDDSFPNLKKALEAKDAPTAFRAAHTLKGVCQNLGFDALYAPVQCPDGSPPRRQRLTVPTSLFPPVEKEYQRVVVALKDWSKTLNLQSASSQLPTEGSLWRRGKASPMPSNGEVAAKSTRGPFGCGCFSLLDEYQELSVIISGLPAEPRSS